MSNEPNPYQPPIEPLGGRGPSTDLVIQGGGEWVPCPRCGSADVVQPSYTWWGGFIGAKMLKHVKCQRCGNGYNGVTGASNTPKIILYQVVILIIVGGFIAMTRM
jgi:hypothetical protein